MEITNYFGINAVKPIQQKRVRYINLVPLNRDVVNFTSKKYDADTIANPTNHCGYCGCKVYTEQQLESIAREILNSKYDRFQGKIKSALEKLEGAKHSEEIALAKRLENEQEIEFFNNFLTTASKKPFLKGETIFEQVYQKMPVKLLNY